MGSSCCKPSKEENDEVCHGHFTGAESAVQMERLVRDALALLRTFENQDQEPPAFVTQLIRLADKKWVLVVETLCRIVPLDDPLGPGMISTVLDDCPLPSREDLMDFVDLLTTLPTGDYAYEKNLCVVLALLADKLAGPSAVSLLNTTTLTFLTERLDYRRNQDTQVILFSLLVLEKFAQTLENKVIIERFIAEQPDMEVHPLRTLEEWVDESDLVRRQVGFCAQWALDNIFILPDRELSYQKVDMTGINVRLNDNDASEYLKISPNGLEARTDASSFEFVRSTFEVSRGCWYYEVHLVTSGIMQIGWATRDSRFSNHDGCGIGDDQYSIAYDGCRQSIWHRARKTPIDHKEWQPGDILGCLLDIDRQDCIFSLNGVALPAVLCSGIFDSTKGSGFFAAASFMTYQQCRFNFGLHELVYPPVDRKYQCFNQCAELSPENARVIPRHVKLRRSSIGVANACSICVDFEATIQLKPCDHSGFCVKCANLLESCPLCRADIFERRSIS
ncbi:RING finger and SPRY domain-containing protein 1 [Galendromus occidentalis]|uniref:RING finger and SPRY domain-containing protein 1 n=1 Tax=Galendromus occidentalis TaxID=34638 RepID=A0AAJ7L7R2_9ACAR|nr:RING finger and SPRY domain-containing protein 1 [Galendromus occidentalis]